MYISSKTLELVNKISSIYKGKTILISGATGMIGQNIVSLLLSMNDCQKTKIRVIAHARNKEKAEFVFKHYKNRNDISFIFSDIVNLDTNEHVDYIIHTASITGGSKQHLDFPMRTISVALEGTKRILDLALKNKASSIFLSSLEVYGFTGNRETNIIESDFGYIDCTNPRSSYSESKRMSECMFSAYAKQFGISTYIARLTASFGQGVSPSDKRVFAQFAQSIINKQDIILKSTGESVRDYCDAEDVASALLFIMARGNSGEAYNIANMNTEISIKDMAKRFTELYPESKSLLRFDLSEEATKLGYNAVMRNVIDSQKLQALGWTPQFNIDEMIRHLVSSLTTQKGT